eukprot:GHVT01008491.1.p1 GENE.GHVT01008491.1~~GHVT01008491.1.p1  ORF type:complete len:169 (+),score=26.56 GHVT01008491.1:120-626(+)
MGVESAQVVRGDGSSAEEPPAPPPDSAPLLSALEQSTGASSGPQLVVDVAGSPLLPNRAEAPCMHSEALKASDDESKQCGAVQVNMPRRVPSRPTTALDTSHTPPLDVAAENFPPGSNAKLTMPDGRTILLQVSRPTIGDEILLDIRPLHDTYNIMTFDPGTTAELTR